MLQIILLIGAALWNANCAAQGDAQAIRSPWVDENDPVWFVVKARGVAVLDYVFQSRRQKLANLAYMDCLLLVNGTTGTCAMLLSNEHVGVGSGFGIADYVEPISMARLTRRAQDNRQRNFVPVHVCGYEQRNGTVMFESTWMPSKTIEYQLQFDNQTQTMTNYQSQGYYVASLCSTKPINGSSIRLLSPNVVIIWHRLRQQQSSSARPEQRIFIDVAESECSAANIQNVRESFYPIVMQLFNKGNAVRCSAVWQKMTAPSLKFELRIGSAPADVVNMIDKRMQPRQISVYRDTMGREQIAVLWTNYSTINISFDGNVFAPQDNIPINWLPGSTAGIKDKDKAKFESMVTTHMRTAQTSALSFALSRNEQLKRAVSFGYANPLTKEAATVSTKFRLGSTSKPITAVAIFTLIDQGKLTLNSTVFAQGGVLGTEYGTKPYSQNVLKVRVVHLLEHTAGFGSVEDVIASFSDLNQSAYIRLVVDKYGPTVEPGTVFRYSNVGYYLLGVIITRLTGKPYDQYVKDALWRPSGVPDARVGITGRWFGDRQPNEAVYYPDAVSNALFDAYDVMDPLRVASAGGWIASPVDMLRISARMNGLGNKPDLLSASSYTEMTRPSNASGGTYCRGLFVGQEFFGFSHDGYYPGAFSRYQRQNNGIELSVLQSKADDSAEIAQAVGTLIRLFIDLTSDWSTATQDLFTT